MSIKLVLQHHKEVTLCTPREFREAMGVVYQSDLQFMDEKLHQKVLKRCVKEDRKKWIDPRQKWLGSYYSQEIRAPFNPDVTISWIDPVFGYGVFTNKPIPRNAYVGEYTGIVRKRRFFGRLKNHYCFDYTIGFGMKTPYVIDAEQHGNYARYINHSDEPNLETASVLCDGVMHIIMYALTDIPAGSQLCYDYGENYWEKRKKPLPLQPH